MLGFPVLAELFTLILPMFTLVSKAHVALLLAVAIALQALKELSRHILLYALPVSDGQSIVSFLVSQVMRNVKRRAGHHIWILTSFHEVHIYGRLLDAVLRSIIRGAAEGRERHQDDDYNRQDLEQARQARWTGLLLICTGLPLPVLLLRLGPSLMKEVLSPRSSAHSGSPPSGEEHIENFLGINLTTCKMYASTPWEAPEAAPREASPEAAPSSIVHV